MAAHRKRPFIHPSLGACAWFNAEGVRPSQGDPASDLPAAVFGRLKGGSFVGICRSYPTLRAACEDLVAAWAAARRGGGSGSRGMRAATTVLKVILFAAVIAAYSYWVFNR